MDRRMTFFIVCAPLIMAGYVIFLATANAHARYAGTFFIASGAFTFGALCNSQVSANVVSDTARSAAIGTNVMMGNIGGLVSTWSFLPFDSPAYHIGNGLNLATSSTILIISIFLLAWMKWDNSKRNLNEADAEISRHTPQECEDLDRRHLEFRWNL